MIRDTSLEAYRGVNFTGKAGTQKVLIIDFLKNHNGKATRREIAKELELETSTVSARVNDLKKIHYVVDDEKVTCPISHKTVTLVELAVA
ncbi:winged helix-turn-helix transcriptional regulator [Sulfurimonas sp.]|uniref:winged helix-turn-helix transcriptional regulator n=1 Tax=Sulfurimonas sp. TaxID=2022749 RepID=UPI003566666B